MDATFYRKCFLWYENFAVNLPVIRDGKDVKNLPKFNEPCVVVGAGPSVWKFGHLDLLKKWRHPIICADKILIPLLKERITPTIVSSVDGDPVIKSFYDDPVVDEHKGDVKAVFAATVHPDVVKRCPFEVYWFVNAHDEPTNPRSLTAAFHFMSKRKSIMVSGGTVGFLNWNLAYFLGADPIILIGYNYSYDVLDITKTTYYNAYLKACGGDVEKVKSYFSIRQNPDFKNWYLLDLMWQVYRDIFKYYVERAKVLTINASEEGSLHSMKNLKSMRFAEVMEKYN